MNDFIKMLKNEMRELDNNIEFKKQLGIENLHGKELIKFKIDFLAKNLDHKELHSIERNNYFKQLLANCIDIPELRKQFDLSIISCKDENKKLKFFDVLRDKENGERIIYSISDNKPILKTSQEEIQEEFSNGMTTLSKSREEELKQILLGKPNSVEERNLEGNERDE